MTAFTWPIARALGLALLVQLSACDSTPAEEWAAQAQVAIDEGRNPDAAYDYEQACSGGLIDACSKLGFLRAEHLGIQQGDIQVTALHNKACDGGIAASCVALGKVRRRARDGEQAIAWFLKGCEIQPGEGCTELATVYQKGKLVAKNSALAVEYFARGCPAHPASCTRMGDIYLAGDGMPSSDAKAARAYAKACTRSTLIGCNRLAWVLATTDDVNVLDPKRAIESARRAMAEHDTSEHHHTLAAAYASAGRFDDAVKQQRVAIQYAQRAHTDTLDMPARLELFQEGEPAPRVLDATP